MKGIVNCIYDPIPPFHFIRKAVGFPVFPRPSEMSDMTVLAVAGALDGIALAADGRRTDASGRFVSDKAQKIWHNVCDGFDLVVGWTGSSTLYAESGASFSFPEIAEKVWLSLRMERMPEIFSEFSSKVKDELQLFLNENVGSGQSKISVTHTTALVGIFIAERPICATLGFWTEDTVANSTSPIVETLIGDFADLATGSFYLWEKRRYKWPSDKNTSLKNAVVELREYVQECIDNENLVPDCKGFGGHLHLATVDRDGFRWEIPPAQ